MSAERGRCRSLDESLAEQHGVACCQSCRQRGWHVLHERSFARVNCPLCEEDDGRLIGFYFACVRFGRFLRLAIRGSFSVLEPW